MSASSQALKRIAHRHPFVKSQITTFYRSVRPQAGRVMTLSGSEMIASAEMLATKLSTFDPAEEDIWPEALLAQRQETILFAVGYDHRAIAHLADGRQTIGDVLKACEFDTVAHLCLVCRRCVELDVPGRDPAWFWELDFLVLHSPLMGFPRALFR